MNVAFEHFRDKYGEAGAPERFENFVVALVKTLHPSAQPVRAHPGDWGIDAYVGSLAQGKVAIWQAKFFLDGILTDSRQQNVRESYTQAKASAEREGYELIEWTLCVPQNFDPKSQKWWDGWRTKTMRDDGIPIELWNLSELRTLLGKPDSVDVRAEYFPHLDAVHPAFPPEVVPLTTSGEYEEMLFIKQLREAGHTEVSSAKEQYYNAELVVRDLQDKMLDRKLALFLGLRSDLRATWEDRFNHHASTGEGRLLPQLHSDVMGKIDASHDAAPDNPFPLTKLHRKGAMQQVVENADAGWVRDFRDVASGHHGS